MLYQAELRPDDARPGARGRAFGAEACRFSLGRALTTQIVDRDVAVWHGSRFDLLGGAVAIRRTQLHVALALAICAALALPLAAPGTADAGCANARAHPKDVSLKKIRGATRCLINARRKNHGLGRLRGNRDLATAAKRHSRDMVENKFFSHSSLSGATPLDRVLRTDYVSGSSSYAIGENIAWGSRWKAKPRAIVKAWMRSSGHRAVMLNSTYRHIGIGVARGAPKTGVRRAATYTANFGRR